MTKNDTGHWKREPDAHDYPAAEAYLSLLTAEADVKVAALKKAPLQHGKAKDLMRASRLPLLRADNVHVERDMHKVRDGEKLSPVLLVRGDPLTVADGYHRICASYHLDEDADIPYRIA